MTPENEEKETQEQEQAEASKEEQPTQPPEAVQEETSGEEEEEEALVSSESEEPPSAPSSTEPDVGEAEPEGAEAEPEGAEPPAAEETAQPASVTATGDESETVEAATEEAPAEQPLPEPEAEAVEEAEAGEPLPEPESAEEAPAEQQVSEPEAAGEAEPVEAEPLTRPAPAEEVAEKKPRVAKPRADRLTTLPEEETAEKRWYVIHAHSGHENKVRQSLENRVRQEHLEHLVSQVLIPSEEVAEVKGGKKRISSRKIFPSYVLVEMKLTHKTWYLIRTTPGVTGFIGSGKMPTPLEPEEVESIFEQMRGEQKKPKPKVSFEKDEKVKIIEGPFTNFMGYVDEVNPERGKLKVMVEIFERLTSVELEFWQVEKI